jgi:ribonuclease HII
LPSSRYERRARHKGFRVIAGADEAGRGSLFGPVFAGAVVLDPERPIRGLDDSKQLAPERREVLALRIKERAAAWAVAAADVYEIDHVNIYQAARLALRRAVDRLRPYPDFLFVDALTLDLAIEQKPLIKGDELCFSISAASILAKVERDATMVLWDKVFPEYGLAQNKGYYTPEHLAALEKHGPTSLHRFSFEPVRNASRFDVWNGYPLPQQGELFACP